MYIGTSLGKAALRIGVAGFVLVGLLLACQPIPGGGGGQYIFKALNWREADYGTAATAEPQFEFTDADTTVYVYFFGSFPSNAQWFIRFLSPSGTDDSDSAESSVPGGSKTYFVSAGGDIETFSENGDWEIALMISGEEIGRGTITIDRESLR